MNSKSIVVLSHGFSSWGGGIDFIRHIANCIAEVNDARVKKKLILPGDDLQHYARKVVTPIRSFARQVLRREPIRWQKWNGFDEEYFRKTFEYLSPDFELEFSGSSYKSQLKVAKKINAGVVLPCMIPPSKDFDSPWIGYIYDFQHRYYPEFFSKEECAQRDQDFIRMLNSANHVIVNAHSVAEDARRFCGDFKAKIYALPFSPCPHPTWFEIRADVKEKYKICEPYFVICNQFWRHKDHETAFKAFAKYKSDGGKGVLICTGGTEDYRFPEYFPALLALIERLGISEHVQILGHIPKLDQIDLVKDSMAVVQPTLFEGGPGGGAAYDAIALGVPLIASDIPVNREIDCGEVVFFPARDVESLAAVMSNLSTKELIKKNPVGLLKEGLARRRICGEFIIDIAKSAIQDFEAEENND